MNRLHFYPYQPSQFTQSTQEYSDKRASLRNAAAQKTIMDIVMYPGYSANRAKRESEHCPLRRKRMPPRTDGYDSLPLQEYQSSLRPHGGAGIRQGNVQPCHVEGTSSRRTQAMLFSKVQSEQTRPAQYIPLRRRSPHDTNTNEPQQLASHAWKEQKQSFFSYSSGQELPAIQGRDKYQSSSSFGNTTLLFHLSTSPKKGNSVNELNGQFPPSDNSSFSITSFNQYGSDFGSEERKQKSDFFNERFGSGKDSSHSATSNHVVNTISITNPLNLNSSNE